MKIATAKRSAAPGLEHRLATKIAAHASCLLCGREGCVPAHWPTHRGMGGANAGWGLFEWIPLCRTCHDLVDRRAGASDAATARQQGAFRSLKRLAPAWWREAFDLIEAAVSDGSR